MPPRTPNRPIHVVLHPAVRRALDEVRRRAEAGRKGASTLNRAIERLFDLLTQDFQHGEVVRKALIPQAVVSRFGVSNLYVEDLPGFRRLLYTVEGDDTAVTVVVLAVLDHPEYDRLFGRGRR